MASCKNLIIATSNTGKVGEFQQMLGSDWKIRTLADFPNLAEVVEDGQTFEENARKKAQEISTQLPGHVLADDSGLEVDALDGAPGIYSARYAGSEKDDSANNRKLLNALDGIPESRRGAQFHCVLALAENGVIRASFEGILRGRILTGPRGKNGFGYDPLFLPNGLDRTTAEMSPEEKHLISHRGKAMRMAIEFLTRSA